MEDDPAWPTTLDALQELARELDAHGAPIDYTRRRRLDYRRLLPPPTWTDLCRHARALPGQAERLRTARRWLFERLSGMPADLAPNPFAIACSEDRARLAAFPRFLTPDLSRELDDYARIFLEEKRITDEPATWHPPTARLNSSALPGPDPAHIDVTALHNLVRHEHLTPRAAARRLATTIDTVRYLLATQPAPPHPRRKIATRSR